ncbi:MAG: hypothetical protein R2695_08595 [Acidimicrobiales bacterium]
MISLTVTGGGYPVDDLTGAYVATATTAGRVDVRDPAGSSAAARGRRPVRRQLRQHHRQRPGRPHGHARRGGRPAGGDLADWVDRSVSFPNSMVDRITPATTDADRRWLTATTGLDDRPVAGRGGIVPAVGGRRPVRGRPSTKLEEARCHRHHRCGAVRAHEVAPAQHDALLPRVPRRARARRDGRRRPGPDLRGFAESFIERGPAGRSLDRGHRPRPLPASIIDRFANPNIGDQIAAPVPRRIGQVPEVPAPHRGAPSSIGGGPVGLAALASDGASTSGALAAPRGRPPAQHGAAPAARSADDPANFLEFVEVFGDDLPKAPRSPMRSPTRSVASAGRSTLGRTVLHETGASP